MLDATDRTIINALQGGFPVCERPYAAAAESLGLEEQDLITRLRRLLENGAASRFGPMYNADRMGGAFCLCAMSVPREEFDDVVAKVNARREVAHNYERDHDFNVWFVLASEKQERIADVIEEIRAETGFDVLAFPKLREFYIGLKVDA